MTVVEWNIVNEEGAPLLQPWSEERAEVESYMVGDAQRLVCRTRVRTPDRVSRWVVA